MMLTFLVALAASLPVAEPIVVDPSAFGMPAGALVLEARRVPQPAPPRAIAIWMVNPERHPRTDPDDPYTCPEETLGHTLGGPTRVSLLDLTNRSLLDTFVIRDPHFAKDQYVLPYRIRAGLYYRVDRTDEHQEGPPILLDFRDVNGDGLAQEFVLFHALSCMGLDTALIGYCAKQDALVQYPVTLRIRLEGQESTRTQLWTDYLFSKAPMAPGTWQYEIDYRGRGGCLDSYYVSYSAPEERFNGTLDHTDCAP